MAKCINGGMPVVSPEPIRVEWSRGSFCKGIRLMSDLHEGRADVNYDLIDYELEDAHKSEDRIILGGDVFESIFPGDKRYRAEDVHPALRGRSDMQNVALKRVEKRLARYADLIDGIGIGNHEAVALHKTAYDIVGDLVERLNGHRSPSLRPIAQLGWASLIQYEVKDGTKQYPPFTVWYHHGSARTSESHRALRTLHEKSKGFHADLYWSGHNHALGQTAEIQMMVWKGKLIPRPVRHVITGAYNMPYQHQDQASMKRHGRRSNYASEAGYNPHALGGARVQLSWDKSVFPRIEITQ